MVANTLFFTLAPATLAALGFPCVFSHIVLAHAAHLQPRQLVARYPGFISRCSGFTRSTSLMSATGPATSAQRPGRTRTKHDDPGRRRQFVPLLGAIHIIRPCQHAFRQRVHLRYVPSIRHESLVLDTILSDMNTRLTYVSPSRTEVL